MKAPVRRVDARVTIDYTDPTQDQTIEVTASEQANVSYPVQTADFATEPTHKWAALDGTWVLDGTWHLAPVPEDAYLYQMGWWSAQVAGEDGRFSEPYPTLILTHPARSVTAFQVVGDSARGEWPTEFAIRLYGPDGSLLRERVVEGNTQVHWQEELDPPALDVTHQELEIRAWSHPGRHAKILEFFTSLQETYEGNDLLKVHLLEESESGNGVGTSDVSTNEITVRLVNRDGRFDVINQQSPLRELLRPNRRVRAWLGVEGAKHLWGEGWYAPFDRDLTLSRQNGTVIEPLPDHVVTRRHGEGRFGGAVAVEEGTTNIAHGKIIYDTTPPVPVPGYPNALAKYTTAASDLVMTLDPEVQAHSVQAWVYMAEDWDYKAWEFRFLLNNEIVRTISADLSKKGQWQHVKGTFVGSADQVQLRSASSGTSQRRWTAMVQIEEKPFATSFVDGTRAAGALSYPITLGRKGTIGFWWNKSKRNVSDYEMPFRLANNVFEANIRDVSADVNGVSASVSWNPGEWHHFAYAWDMDASGTKQWLFIDGQLKATSTSAPPDPTAYSTLYVGWGGNRFWFNGLIDELLILPFAASDEIIAELYRETRPLCDEWVPLGVFWSTDWDSQDLEAMVRARDRMELLRRMTYEPGPLKQNVSLYELAQDVLTYAKMLPETYRLDPELQDIVVPWGWVPPGSHRDALRIIVEAGLARAYCDRDGILRIQRLTTGQHVPLLDITSSDYFPPMRSPSSSISVANRVVVTTQPLVPAASLEEVYRATVDVPSGATITVRAEYRKRPVIDAAASLENPPAGVSIVEDTYGAASAEVMIRNTGASAASVALVITGRPLSVEGGEQVMEEDDLSIREFGLIVHEVPSNPLVQTREHAQAIAQAILARSAKQRRDVELEWRGNPALEAGDCVRIVGIPAEIVRQELEWAGALSARIIARRLSQI